MYAIYARQSRDKKDSISIESQFEFCKREIPEGADVKKYYDKGYSGKDIDRPDFQRMLKDIKRGLINKVIVYRLDRMSRSTLDFAGLMELFNKYNVEFVSTTEKFDTSTPIGKAMLNIIMVFAELERETIRQRITDNYYERGKKGMYLGGNAPFGFDITPTKIDGNHTSMLQPTDDMPYVINLFNKYAYEKVSLQNLAYWLNENDIKTAFGNYWDSAKISRLLKNPVYVKADIDIYNYFKNMGCILHNDITEYLGENGLYVYGNNMPSSMKFQNLEGYHVVLAPHKGFIDSKTWLKCQYKLSKNKQIKNTGTSRYTWLSGLVKCRKCSYAMTINRSILSKKNNTYATYFRCSGRALKKICDTSSVRVGEVEKIVQQRIFDYLKTLSNKLQTNTVETTKKINDLKAQIAIKENEIENLIDNLTQAQSAAMKYINQRINKLDNELSLLREELKKESYSGNISGEKIVELNNLLPLWDKIDLEDKKQLASSLIDRIFIEKNDEQLICDITWKY